MVGMVPRIHKLVLLSDNRTQRLQNLAKAPTLKTPSPRHLIHPAKDSIRPKSRRTFRGEAVGMHLMIQSHEESKKAFSQQIKKGVSRHVRKPTAKVLTAAAA